MKYMGSKAKIANDIINVIKDNNIFQKPQFVDLFCGGCNFTQSLNGIFDNVIANDMNPYLTAMWDRLTHSDMSFPEVIEKELYVEWRYYYNRTKKNKEVTNIFATDSNTINNYAMCGWIGYMGSFNGRFYDGGYSGHAVTNKSGGTRDYISEQIANTKKQIPYLRNCVFTNHSYKYYPIQDNSIVYCDIPYKGTKQYGNSTNFDYNTFYEWCLKTAKEKNIQLYVSEYNMPEDMFTCVWQKEVTNAMNPTKTKKPIEKLFIPKL